MQDNSSNLDSDNLNKFVYKPVIKSIVKNLLHRRKHELPKDLNKRIPVKDFKEGKYTTLSYLEYAMYLYQGIEKTTSVNIGFLNKMYVDILSEQKVYPVDIKCSISIYIVYPDMIHVKDGKSFKINSEMKEFGEYILELSEHCKFFAIYTSLVTKVGGHANMIFGENISSTDAIGDKMTNNKTVLNYYEPHGTKFFTKEIASVLDKIQRSSNGKIITNYYGMSNYIGAQLYSLDSVGYCVMFSLFWIYLVLNIVVYNINNNSYIPSTFWIDEVEYYYMKLLTRRDIMDIIVTFAIQQFNDFIHLIAPYPHAVEYVLDDTKELLLKQTKGREATYGVNWEDIDKVDDIKIDLKDSVDNKDGSIDNDEDNPFPKYSYDEWQRLKKVEKLFAKNLRQFGEKRGYKLTIGKKCVHNKDCISNSCVYDSDTKTKHCVPSD